MNRPTSSFTMGGTQFDLPKEYIPEKYLGFGSSGEVVSVMNIRTGKQCAIKKIASPFQNKITAKRVLLELQTLHHLNHENVIHLSDVFGSEDTLYIVMDLMETHLGMVIGSQVPLSEEHIQLILYQIIRAVKYIHSAEITHRDLKPANVLVNSDCSLQVADFGLARSTGGLLTEYITTRWYRAPEVMLSPCSYSKPLDMWSIGCIFAEMLLRRPLFAGKDYLDQLQLIFRTMGMPSEEDIAYVTNQPARKFISSIPMEESPLFPEMFKEVSAEGQDLLLGLLHYNPSHRLTAERALAHPYFGFLHDLSDEPVCPTRFPMEESDLSLEVLRSKITDFIQNVKEVKEMDRVIASCERGYNSNSNLLSCTNSVEFGTPQEQFACFAGMGMKDSQLPISICSSLCSPPSVCLPGSVNCT